MRAIAVVALLLVLLTPQALLACPTAKPDAGQFFMTASRACTAAQPCTTSQTLTFSLVKRTTCYPSWAPCPGYVIQACDRVSWDFGDGSPVQTVTGASTITHRFAPGKHTVQATVTNALGTAVQQHDLHIGMEPVSFIQFEKSQYTYGEADGVALVTLVRTGDSSRRVPLTIETSDLPLIPTRTNVTFEAGETKKTVGIPIANDTTNHSWLPAWVWAHQTGGEAILTDGAIAHTNVSIVEDDKRVVITPVLANATIIEGEDVTPVRIGIRMSNPIDQAVRLIATVWDVKSTGRWGSDWRAQWTEIEIPPGKTEAFYDVDILGDSLAEPTETVVIYLGRSTNPHDPEPEFQGWPVTLTILDDDSPANPVTAKINPDRVAMNPGERAQVHFATTASNVARTVTITSSNPDVAYVMMPEQTLLAGYSAMPFTIDVRGPGQATLTATLPDGLSATVAVTVGTASTPALPDVAFVPGNADLALGGSQTIRIDAGNTTDATRTVSITASSSGIVSFPATVLIPAGASSANFTLLTEKAGITTLTARFADGRLTIMAVKVTDTQSVLTLSEPAPVVAGTIQTSTLVLRPIGTAEVTLRASQPGIVSIPSSVTLAANGRGTMNILGLKAGTVEITATTKTKSGQTVSTSLRVTVAEKKTSRRRAL
jgi:PKD repeat protein